MATEDHDDLGSHSHSDLATLVMDDNNAGGLDGGIEDNLSADVCRICDEKLKNPKVLSCLHVFCEECLKKKFEDAKAQENSSPASPLAKEWMLDVIICPICEQRTRIGDKGISGLLSDTVLEDIMDSDSSEKKQIGCTSCKAGDNAVARCTTCENLLCPNCCKAHEFILCFEGHKVVSFEEMIASGEGIDHLRKPVFCNIHPAETIKFFCVHCSMPACQECVQKSHSGPDCIVKQLPEAIRGKKETLGKFTAECSKKLSECTDMSSNLNLAFEELEMQKDNTKGLIEETFQSYKAVLEEARDAFLKELDELHEKRELCLMERGNKLSNYETQLSQAKCFVERVTQHGHVGQVAQLLQTMMNQLNNLCMGFLMPDIPAATEFKSDATTFTAAVKSYFGFFTKENDVKDQPDIQSHFDIEGFNLPSMIPLGGSNNNFLPSPNSQELVNIGNLRGALNQARVDNVPVGNVIAGMSNMALVPHHDTQTGSGNNSPLSDSGISVDNVSVSGGNTAMINAAAMAKLHQSQSPLFAPGMSMSERLNMSQSTPIISGSGDNSLANILGVATPMSSSAAVRNSNIEGLVRNSNIEGLRSLLNQPPPATANNRFKGNYQNSNTTSFMQQNSNTNYNSGGSFEHFSTSSPVSELGSPNFNEPYPPVRRQTHMNEMQISRFSDTQGMGDTEIGHWGPQLKQVNEVPLRVKFGQLGPGQGQFNSPHGFCLGIDEDIVVADTNNHRIQVFQTGGDFKYQFGIPGREEGQLWYPRKVAVILKTGKFVVCDRGNERSRMQIFNRNGNFLRKIAIRYIDIVAGLAITSEGYIVAVDSVSPTVFCISETGDLLKWFDCSDFMREPSDIAIHDGEYYVCDFKGHCVVVFSKEGQFLRRIGCENITNYPNGIDIGGLGDVLIGDGHGNRFHVGVFQKDGSVISEFQCPYVKVSRCCGLKITREGYIVTLAKNNHHVLVLNTLFIP